MTNGQVQVGNTANSRSVEKTLHPLAGTLELGEYLSSQLEIARLNTFPLSGFYLTFLGSQFIVLMI